MSKQAKGLKDSTIWLMIGTAALFDCVQIALQAIPWVGQILGWLISGLGYGTFALWFAFYGLNFFSRRRMKSLVGGAIAEIATAGFLTGLTFAVWKAAFASRETQPAQETPNIEPTPDPASA